MKRLLLLVTLACPLLLTSFSITAQTHPLISLYQQTETLYQEKNYTTYLPKAKELVKQIYSPSLLIKIAKAHQLNNQSDSAKHYLEKLLEIQACAMVDTMIAFSSLTSDKAFSRLATKLQRNCKAINLAEQAIRLKDEKLIPEGMAYHAVSGDFFIGSLAKNKVLRFQESGNETVFVPAKKHNLLSVVGMEVDMKQEVLWLCSSSEQEGKNTQAALYGFRIKDGTLFKKINTPDKGIHFLNDIELIDDQVFVTDSDAGKVYRATSPYGTLLEEVQIPEQLVYPNGICSDPSQRYLFIADALGILRYDLELLQATRLKADGKSHLNLIDGLYWYNKGLVAIQGVNATQTRIVQFQLNSELTQVDKVHVRQTEHPLFNFPTTGAIVGKYFYFIANSQIRALQPDGSLINPEKLQAPLIMKVKLK